MGKTKKVDEAEWNQLNDDKAKLTPNSFVNPITSDLEAKDAELEKLRKERDADSKKNKDSTDDLKKRMDKESKRLKTIEKERDDIKADLDKKETQLDKLQKDKDTLSKDKEKLRKSISGKEKEASAPQIYLDVTVNACEFARPAHYYIAVQTGEDQEPRRTETSQASQFPLFEACSFLLPFHNEVAPENQVILTAYVVTNPGLPNSTTTKLGQAFVNIAELGTAKQLDVTNDKNKFDTEYQDAFRNPDIEADIQMMKNGVSELQQKTIVRTINFVRQRKAKTSDGESMTTVVGKCTVKIERKMMKPSEALGARINPSTSNSGLDIAKAGNDYVQQTAALEKSLWPANGFQPRIKLLLHCVRDLNIPPEMFNSKNDDPAVLATARILRADGSVLVDSTCGEVAIRPEQNPLQVDYLDINQEVYLPLEGLDPTSRSGAVGGSNAMREHRCEVSIELVNETQTLEVLKVTFFLNVLPAFWPVTIHCTRKAKGKNSPNNSPGKRAKNSPELCFTLTRESDFNELTERTHPVELRVNRIVPERPLPDPSNNAVVVVSPDFPSTGDLPVPKIPIATYFYDAHADLSTFLENWYEDLEQGKRRNFDLAESQAVFPKFFLSAACIGRSRAPNFDGYVLRIAVPESAKLQNLSLFLMEKNLLQSEPEGLISDHHLGFTTLDCSTLTPPDGARDGITRGYLLDVRLLENPASATNLDIDCRVWPRNCKFVASDPRSASPVQYVNAQSNNFDFMNKNAASNNLFFNNQAGGEGLNLNGSNSMNLNNNPHMSLASQQQEFKLNQDLSLQLMKEFNLRAAALKQAGGEIINLKNKIQILKNENSKLKSQIQEEEEFNEEVKLNYPIDEFLDQLSGPELATKLQVTLAKYREEKGKVTEMKQRLELAMREIMKNRGLEKQLEELEKAHLEQASLLQKYQKDAKRIPLYKETARNQEKVIAKLEKVLESSLDDLQKAQQTQMELDTVRMENASLKKEYASITKKVEAGAGSSDAYRDLIRKNGEKEAEIDKLKHILEDVKASSNNINPRHSVVPDASSGGGADTKRLQEEKQMLQLKISTLFSLIIRMSTLETRIMNCEDVIKTSSKEQSKIIADLKMQIAKKDAKIRELEKLVGK